VLLRQRREDVGTGIGSLDRLSVPLDDDATEQSLQLEVLVLRRIAACRGASVYTLRSPLALTLHGKLARPVTQHVTLQSWEQNVAASPATV
jgi:hypothetical protein